MMTSRPFRFDLPDGEYELIETESGVPAMFADSGYGSEPPEQAQSTPAGVSAVLTENRKRLYRAFRIDINPDVILRSFSICGAVDAMAVFVNGMADADQINDFILKPAMRSRSKIEEETSRTAFATAHLFSMQETEITSDWEIVKSAILEGRTVVFIDGDEKVVIMDTRGFVGRSVSTATNETVVLGPKEAFTENLRTNVTLLRRIIKTDDFICEFRSSGGANNTRIAIAYRYTLANESLLLEVKRRLADVKTDMVLATGKIEQLTELHQSCPLPMTLSTERPDRVAAHILNGSVAVIVEGAPIVMVMPCTLYTLMSSAEDTYMRQPIGTIVRVIRYFGAFLSIVMPGYFVALCMHHQGMLSGEVLATVVASRSMVFMPLPLETIFLLLIFQLVREAALSVPGVLGQSVGIFGGLLLGQAAVSANISSSVVLIVVALSGLGNFAIPDYSTKLSVPYFRIGLVLVAWTGGLLGLFSASLLAVAWMAGLKSYGVPFLSPVSPRTNAKGPAILRGTMKNDVRVTDYVNTKEQRA